MNTNRRLTMCCIVALCALAACSQRASIGQPGGSANSRQGAAAQPTTGDTGNTPANPCDRAIAPADVAGIINDPVTRDPSPTPTTCVYRAKSHANVTIDVERGDTAKGVWLLATTYNATKVPLVGIGEQALYNPNGTTLIARKGDLACRVDVVGYDSADAMDSITKDRGEALARKLGALCNKVFSAY